MSYEKLSADELRLHKGKSFTGISTAFVCYDEDGRVLLAKRSKNARDEHGNWDMGAGGLKFGQTLEQNLWREVKEEYNFSPLKTDFIGYVDAFRIAPDGEPTHWLAMYFAVKVKASEFKVNEPEMIDEYGWFTLDNLPTPLHTQITPFLQKHGARLHKIIDKK
jgi:8-oxo-dGTP diphosphatase